MILEHKKIAISLLIVLFDQSYGSRAATLLPTPSGPKGSSGNSSCRVSGSWKAQARKSVCAFFGWEKSGKYLDFPLRAGNSKLLSNAKLFECDLFELGGRTKLDTDS